MVQVPKYQPNVAERPILQQSLTTRANANDFGAQIGAGMGALAQGAQQASNALTELQRLEGAAQAEDRDNQLAAWDRNAKFGEGGYMTLLGKAAVDARTKYERDLATERSRLGEGLSGYGAQAYGRVSDARVNSSLESSIVHQGQQRKVWLSETSKARQDTFKEDALAVWDKPVQVEKNIAAGQLAIRQQAELMGWDNETLRNAEVQYISDVRKDVAVRLAQDDPLAADAYIQEHKDQLTGPHQSELHALLVAPVLAANSLKMADEIQDAAIGAIAAAGDVAPTLNGQPIDMNGPRQNYTDVARSMVGMTEGRDFDAIASFIRKSSGLEVDPRSTAWCAAFVNAVLGANGVEGTGKLNARSFLSFGSPTNAPAVGDIVVLSRGDPNGWQGHVGFFAGYDADGKVRIVGGNQGDSVSEASYDAAQVLGFRKVTQQSGEGGILPTQNPAGLASIEQQLQGITDPRLREATRAELSRRAAAQEKALKAQREQTQMNVEQYMIANPGVSVQSLPVEVQQVLGVDGLKTLMTWQDQVTAAGEPETDFKLLYDLQTQYADDPVAFAEEDVFQYRDRLSDEDYKTVTDWRQKARTGRREAAAAGLNIQAAFTSATTALEAAGIATGTSEAGRAAAPRVAKFQMVLAQEMQSFKETNERDPDAMEVQALISRLLLPIVIKKPSKEWWEIGARDLFSGGDQAGKLFEAGYQPDGAVVDVALEYHDVPIDFRARIRADLEASTGRTPTEQEITDTYEEYLLGR